MFVLIKFALFIIEQEQGIKKYYCQVG